MPRNYRHEYVKRYGASQSTATLEQLNERKRKSCRNSVRAAWKRRGRVFPPGMDIDHVDGNPCNNSASNTRLMHRSVNRSGAKRAVLAEKRK